MLTPTTNSGTAASEGVGASPRLSSSTSGFRRNASTASVASVHQTFFDSEPAEGVPSLKQGGNTTTSGDTFGLSAAAPAAAAVSPLPIPPGIPQLRVWHGPSLSNTQQAFFDGEDGGADAGRRHVCAAPPGSQRVEKDGRHTRVATTLQGTPLRANPLNSFQGVTTELEKSGSVVNGDTHQRATDIPCGGFSKALSSEPLSDFHRQYGDSNNPYLRAAARAMEAPPDDDPLLDWGSGGFTEMRAGDKAPSGMLFERSSSPDIHQGRGRAAPFSFAPYTGPQLSRPFGSSALRRAAVTPFSAGRSATVPSIGDPCPSAQLRGIPLFPLSRQKACLASPSAPASSLRQSLEEYGQLQLQDEAVRWYHRSSELEHQLAQLQEAYGRQLKLLAAQRQRKEQEKSATSTKACIKTAASTPATGAAAEGSAADDAKGENAQQQARGTPWSRGLVGDEAATTTTAPATGLAESLLAQSSSPVSRSPDSLRRTWAHGEVAETDGMEGPRSSPCGDEDEGEEMAVGSPSAPRMAESEAALEDVTESAMHYAVPRPHVESNNSPRSTPDGAAGDSIRSMSCRIRRGGAALAERSGGEGSIRVVADARREEPTRATAGVQTDAQAPASIAAAFVRVDGESSSTVHPVDATAADSAVAKNGAFGRVSPPSPPAPSAILARQYAEAVAEVDSMRVRLDVVEREADELRERCVAQELRCDDLETQLVAKEEQLMRNMQQPPPAPALAPEVDERGRGDGAAAVETPAGEPAKPSTPVALLKPLLAQLTDLLGSVRRARDGFLGDSREAVEFSKAAAATDGRAVLLLLEDTANGAGKRPTSPGSEVDNAGDDVAQMRSLIHQAHQSLQQFYQQHAALRAELDVVRADRNELIGEQSEQVRLLQQQLLEKDTEQLQLVERLHTAEQLAAAAAATATAAKGKEADILEPPGLTAASPGADDDEGGVHGSRTERVSAPSVAVAALPPQATSPSAADVLAREVKDLKAQLAEAKAAAAAAQQAQRGVLLERVELLQTELRNTRLQAEDEYDRLCSTIEDLTRELADTKEALRIKEVSLRIALRESSPATVLLAAAEHETSDAALNDVALAVSAATRRSSRFLADSPPPTSSSALQLLLDRSHESARAIRSTATSCQSSPRVRRSSQYSGSSSSASPSPPVPSPPHPSPVPRRAVDPGHSTDCGMTDAYNDIEAHAPTMPSTSPPNRGKVFRDDGTLRTLPSSIPMEGDEGIEEAHDHAAEGALRTTAAFSFTSREKSSRGLTTSTGAGSHATSSSSRHRGRSDSADNVVRHPLTLLDDVPPEEGKALPVTDGTGPAPAMRLAPLAQRATSPTDTATLVETTGTRQAASARTTNTVAEEEVATSLPFPLRGPLFRDIPAAFSPAFTLTASAASVRDRRLPLQPSAVQAATTNAVNESAVAAASSSSLPSPSPFRNELRHRRTPRPASMSPPSSPEERLRNFLHSAAGVVGLVDGEVSTPPIKGLPGRVLITDERLMSLTRHDNDVQGSAVAGDTTTPTRATPVSLLSERTPFHLSALAAVTPFSLVGGSPRVSEVAARHTHASLHRQREVWQQQQSLLQSLLSSPSP
jgi:hypothetical protein